MAYCESCGKPQDGGQKFCPYCGKPVAQPGAPAPPGGPPGAGPPPVAQPPPPSAAGGAFGVAGQPPGAGYPPVGWSAPQPSSSRKWLWIGGAAVVVIAAIVCVLVFAVFNGGGSGGGTPADTVQRFFTAMENKDLDGILALMDPAALEGMPTGAELEAAKAEIAQDLFDYQSVKFSNMEMSTAMTGDSTATVTVTRGIATMTDTDGSTSVDNIEDSDSPVTVDLVKKDGSWYMESSPFF